MSLLPKLFNRKYLKTLLIAVLITHLADYLIIPILPVILSEDKGLIPAQIGTILAVGAIFFQVGSTLGGMLSDRIGRKVTLIIGSVTVICALIGYGLSNTYPFFLLFQALNNLGGGFYAPTIKAAIAEHASDSKDVRTTAFSLRGMAAHSGIVIAGLLTLIFVTFTPTMIFFSAAFFYLILLIISIFFIPNSCHKDECEKMTFKRYLAIFKNIPFLLFCIITILVWGIYSLLAFLLPLRGAAVLANGRLVGSIWTITSFFVVIMQSIITRKILRKIHLFSSIYIGVLIIGTGLFLIGISYSYVTLLLAALVFVFGEMFTTPTIDSITSELADQKIIGAYFSITNILYGIGVALGNFFGGQIINRFGVKATLTPWFIFLGISLAIAVFAFIVRRLKIIDQALNQEKT